MSYASNGATLEGGEFRYHPAELFRFIYAIRRVADDAR